MTANDHADCGSADSEFSSQVLLTLTGPVYFGWKADQ